MKINTHQSNFNYTYDNFSSNNYVTSNIPNLIRNNNNRFQNNEFENEFGPGGLLLDQARFHIGSINRVQNSHLLKEKRITYTPNIIRGRFKKNPEDKSFYKALSVNKKLVNVLKNKMFKGYDKVNSILNEKLNSFSEIKNISSINLQKSREFNIIDQIKNKKKAESLGNINKYNKNDLMKGKYYNFEEKEDSVNFNESRTIRDIDKEESNKKNIYNKENLESPLNEKHNDLKSIEKNNPKKAKSSKKMNKKNKSDIDLSNALHLHVDHFPKPSQKTVKMRDQVTDMPEGTNTHNLFLTQNNSEINSVEAKKKLIKDLKTKHNISYINDISQVNQIKFFAFEVKNPGYKDHFNNKFVQIEKEILKEIDKIKKEQGDIHNQELEKTKYFYDLDQSKVFEITKRNKSASNPNYYGRPISKQNFKTNPGLIRGFLRNFKNNKLLTEFFKYKREKDKRERFHLQSNDFSGSQNFRNDNTSSNNDYVETYYIGKNLNGTIKNASLTQNEFNQNNEVEKMKKYFEMIKKQRINEEDELNDLNNLNQDLYINKDFIKEFNEYALKLARGEISNEQIPNFNDDLGNHYNNFIGLNKNIEQNRINLDVELKEPIPKLNKIDNLSQNKKNKSDLQKDPMDNLVNEIFHSNNSQRSNLSPKAIFTNGSPQNFQFNYYIKPEKENKKIKNSEKLDKKYLDENFYEESIDEDETKKVMLLVNDPKFNKIGSFVKGKEMSFYRQTSNSQEPQNTNTNCDKDAKFQDNMNLKYKNLRNKNTSKNIVIKAPINIEDPEKTLENENFNKRNRKSKFEKNDKESLEPNRNLNLKALKDTVKNENTNENKLLTINNTQKNIKTLTIENPTEILQSGLSDEDDIKNTKKQEGEGLFENEDNTRNLAYNDYYTKQQENKAFSPPTFLRANLHGKNASNSVYNTFQKRNKMVNKKNIWPPNIINNEYYKPMSDKVFKNNFKNIKKNKFNRLKDIVFGYENDEYKQNMIKDNNSHLNNISSHANGAYNKKPTTAPVIKKTKSPLRSLINNQMDLIIKNHNIY